MAHCASIVRKMRDGWAFVAPPGRGGNFQDTSSFDLLPVRRGAAHTVGSGLDLAEPW